MKVNIENNVYITIIVLSLHDKKGKNHSNRRTQYKQIQFMALFILTIDDKKGEKNTIKLNTKNHILIVFCVMSCRDKKVSLRSVFFLLP